MTIPLATRLGALAYPSSETFAADESSAVALAVWLEDRFIRQLKVEEREELRAGKPEALREYLVELDAPAWVLNAPSRETACSWLVNIALQFEYEEQKAKLEAAALAQPLAPDDAGLHALANALRVTPGSDAVATLQAVLKAARQRPRPPPPPVPVPKRVTPASRVGAAPASGVGATASGRGAELAELSAESFPLGFAGSGRATLDDAARVLRMLHVRELRRLQDAVNEAVVGLQEFTANPKTDSRLGRVGR